MAEAKTSFYNPNIAAYDTVVVGGPSQLSYGMRV